GNELPARVARGCKLSCDVVRIRGICSGTTDACHRNVHPTAAYRKLDTWQAAMEFVEHCYKTTRAFPREELYGLTSQFRRAAVSIPSNIAEGYCRRNTKLYVNHVGIALGSHGEVETYIELSCRLGFIAASERARLETLAGD